MKAIVFLLTMVLLPYACLGQKIQLAGQIIDSQANAGLAGATVLLKQDTIVVAGTAASQDGSFKLPAVSMGEYVLEVRFLVYRPKTVHYVAVVSNPAPLRIMVPGFCPYGRKGKPRCPSSYADYLIPIVYGLPSTKTMARAKQGKVYLAGCQLTGCDPRYYCPTHKLQL